MHWGSAKMIGSSFIRIYKFTSTQKLRLKESHDSLRVSYHSCLKKLKLSLSFFKKYEGFQAPVLSAEEPPTHPPHAEPKREPPSWNCSLCLAFPRFSNCPGYLINFQQPEQYIMLSCQLPMKRRGVFFPFFLC